MLSVTYPLEYSTQLTVIHVSQDTDVSDVGRILLKSL